MTNTNSQKETGSVTSSLNGAPFVDLEPKDSKKFHIIATFGEYELLSVLLQIVTSLKSNESYIDKT